MLRLSGFILAPHFFFLYTTSTPSAYALKFIPNLTISYHLHCGPLIWITIFCLEQPSNPTGPPVSTLTPTQWSPYTATIILLKYKADNIIPVLKTIQWASHLT